MLGLREEPVCAWNHCIEKMPVPLLHMDTKPAQSPLAQQHTITVLCIGLLLRHIAVGYNAADCSWKVGTAEQVRDALLVVGQM